MTISTTKNNFLQILKGVAVFIICLCIWQILAITVDDSYFLPDVRETFIALGGLITKGKFYLQVMISFLRVGAGLLLGIIAGVLLATLCHVFSALSSFVAPIISVMKATPIATVILILWFTFTDASLAIFVVFLMVTPIIWQNVYDGYSSIPTELREVCYAYEFSFFKRMRILVFPALLKYFIPAVITSIGLAWKAEIAAEIMTYSNIGRSIQDFKTVSYDSASVFAWALVIIALSMILEKLTRLILGRIKI